MTTTARGLRQLFPFFVLAGLILIHSGSSPERLNAQSQATPANTEIPFSSVGVQASLPPDVAATSQGNLPPGPGLTIIPTFDASIDAATQTVINNVIAYFEKTIVSNITINIEFYNMSTGLGHSYFLFYTLPYSSYRTALGNNATSPDDATALANTPSGSNPADGSANIGVKSATGRALGLGTPELLLNFAGSPCPTFTGSGCIGLNVTSANSHGDLTAVVEHEIDEVLGLGSALSGATTTTPPWAEDLFRWGSPGARNYAANSSTTNPCGISTPAAFLSIDGGNTNLDQFNNCNNGGDYGDWITHSPSQVQDAFTDFSASPSLTVSSPEVRALDVMGFNIAFRHFADTSVWRPSSGTWYIIPRSAPSTSVVRQWGASGDVPLRGDFDGDGINDIAVWRPSSGQWYIIPSSNPGSPIVQQWGAQGDIPVPGDYDGDGITDFAVFRPSSGTWYIIPSSNPGSPIVRQWGTTGDVPLPGDYDGDRKSDIAIFRPSTGTWYIIPSGNPGSPIVRQWGASGDNPVPGDYDGDGITDIAVWRPSSGLWYIIPSSNPGSPIIQQWGASGDTPVPGDYDGDGKADMAVWRPLNGVWYVIPSTAPLTPTATQWGTNGDVPIEKPIGQ